MSVLWEKYRGEVEAAQNDRFNRSQLVPRAEQSVLMRVRHKARLSVAELARLLLIEDQGSKDLT
jgi:hypothetical protein